MMKSKRSLMFVIAIFLFVVGCSILSPLKNKTENKNNNNHQDTSPQELIIEGSSYDLTNLESEREKCLVAFTQSDVKEHTNKDGGVVSGYVYYPSEGIPQGTKVCAYRIEENIRYCEPFKIKENRSVYELRIPEGRYYIYLLSPEDLIGVDGAEKERDYIIFREKDGLKFGESPLFVDVREGSQSSIDVGDHIIPYKLLYCPELN
jgi:hypothetical protein